MKPLIVLTGAAGMLENGTATYIINQNYVQAIAAAGGVPLLAIDGDCGDRYAEIADGLLLTGGKDINPALYGQSIRYETVTCDVHRDELEWKVLEAFIKRKKPVMGICRGFQLINIYFGGTLYQDIPKELGGNHSNGICHTVTAQTHSLTARLFGTEYTVNSYHHQALNHIGNGLAATAFSYTDAKLIPEAIEHIMLPLFAVQWHPERMTGSILNPANGIDMKPLFEHLIMLSKGQI